MLKNRIPINGMLKNCHKLIVSLPDGSNNTNKWNAQEQDSVRTGALIRSNNTNKWNAQEHG